MPNADQTAAIELLVPPQGTLLIPDDYAAAAVSGAVGVAAFTENTVGRVLAALDISNGLPPANAVALVPQGGMVIQASGTPAWLVAQGRVLDQGVATNLTISTADATNPRIDLICVRATRVAGAQQVTRMVRSDAAPLQRLPMTATLVAGTVTVTLPAGYTVAPVVDGIEAVGANANGGTPDVISTSTTQVVITSKKADGTTDATDTRVVNFQVDGNPTGATGVSTNINTYENRPGWQVVQGTPAGTPVAPAPPTGWEAFATVAVAANQTRIISGNITIPFPTVPSLATGVVRSVTADEATVHSTGGTTPAISLKHGDYVDVANNQTGIAGNKEFLGNVDVEGTLNVDGAATFGTAPTMSGANITASTIPDNSLVTSPVTAVTADEATVHSTGGTTPAISLKHGNYVDVANNQTGIAGNKEFLGNVDVEGTLNVDGAATFGTRPVSSGLSVLAYGTTSGRSGSATLTLPNDGLTYAVRVTWTIGVSGDTGDIASVSGGGTSNFQHMSSQGYTSGDFTARAWVTAVASGQTLTFPLASGGGSTTAGGVWDALAVAQ